MSKSYVSVKLIKKIIETFGSQIDKDFLQQLESNIIAYHAWNGWDVINPILPIQETPQLYSVVFHILGDGNASLRHSPYYSNMCEELIETFKENLQVFGNVEIKEKLRGDGLAIAYFPKAITDAISHILEIKFTHKTIPKSIFDAPLECRASASRAFVDDEGCVSNCFCITQKSKYILEEMKSLLNTIDIRTGKICENNGIHHIYVFSESYEKFLRIIGFSHPRKRKLLEELNNDIKNRRKIRIKNQIKYKVLKLLNEKNSLNKHEVAKILNISSDSALHTLLNLKDERKVIGKFVGTNKPYIWYPKVLHE